MNQFRVYDGNCIIISGKSYKIDLIIPEKRRIINIKSKENVEFHKLACEMQKRGNHAINTHSDDGSECHTAHTFIDITGLYPETKKLHIREFRKNGQQDGVQDSAALYVVHECI